MNSRPTRIWGLGGRLLTNTMKFVSCSAVNFLFTSSINDSAIFRSRHGNSNKYSVYMAEILPNFVASFASFCLLFLIFSPSFLSASGQADECQHVIVQSVPWELWEPRDPIYLQKILIVFPEIDFPGLDILPDLRPSSMTRVEYWMRPPVAKILSINPPSSAMIKQYQIRYFGRRAGKDIEAELISKCQKKGWTVQPGQWTFRPVGMDKNVYVGLDTAQLKFNSGTTEGVINVATFRDSQCQWWSRVLVVLNVRMDQT